MTWEPLAKQNPLSLPLVLAGPILRRTTPISVSVWLALYQKKTVTLRVFENNGSEVQGLVCPPTEPITIGPGLHIVCVTAQSDTPQLSPGVVYTYDLEFTKVGSEFTENLVNLNLTQEISYGGEDTLPSFILPAATRADLILCQASCRKPHGIGRDALPVLDKRLEEHYQDPVNHPKRPQLLILTGDQIYADDVADALLKMIMDASQTLMAFDEEISDWGLVSGLLPGTRAAIADQNDNGFFTAAIPDKPQFAKSHLLGFSEYLLMYIFAWSNVLWSGNGTVAQLPTYEQATEKMPTKKVSRHSGRGGVWEGAMPTPEAVCFDDEVMELQNFYKDLGRVRRVLANITTYMIFDDHEITDDWYINGRWCKAALESDAGRHVIANGLAAFALCQAWGNTPEEFTSGNGKNLFDAIKHEKYKSNHTELEDLLLPPKNNIFSSDYKLNQPTNSIKWHFDIEYEIFHLIVVDTRTRRQFPDDKIGFAYLIDPEAIQEQLINPTKELIVLVFPPPLFGPPGIEEYQLSRSTFEERLYRDCEAPGLQPVFVQRILSRLAQSAPMQNGQKSAAILVFSGDVHFGFAARLRFSSKRAFEEASPSVPTELVILQLTASSAKNTVAGDTTEDIKGMALRWLGLPESVGGHPSILEFPLPGKDLPKIRNFFGYPDRENLNDHVSLFIRALLERNQTKQAFDFWKTRERSISKLSPTKGLLLDVSEGDPTTLGNLAQEWSFRLEFLEDQELPSEGIPHIRGREAVPDTNLGLVTFEGDNVRFDLWWFPDENQPTQPATSFLASLRFELI